MPFDFITAAVVARGYVRARQWSDFELFQNHPVIDIHSRDRPLHHPGNFVAPNGQIIVVELDVVRRKSPLRLLCLTCPECNRHNCRKLYERDGVFVCRHCSGYDYYCRHRDRDRTKSRSGLAKRHQRMLAAAIKHFGKPDDDAAG
jgi:hypothetical protein